MGHLIGDLRYAFRSLSAQPTLSAIAVLTLVLGIGANTAIFSVIKGVLLDRLAYPESDRLVVLFERNPDGSLSDVSVPTFEDWREQATQLDDVASFRNTRYTFSGRGDPLDVPAVQATPNLFDLLRTNAVVGRTFVAQEGTPGRDQVVILSHGFWQRQFGGSAAAIGQTVQLDVEPFEVVGVMGPGFEFPPGEAVEMWTPLAFDPTDMHGRSRRSRSLSVVGRLAPGSTIAAAARQLDVVAEGIAVEYADSNAGWGARMVPAHEQLVGDVRPALFVILAAVGFLLLIVCANVANLMLARLSGRQREIAVRTALGAGRFDLVRQVLVESLLLSVIGGGLGVLVAVGAIRVVHSLPPDSLPRLATVQIDGGVLLFALGLSVLVALAFGLLPALQASRPGLRETLGETSGTTGSISTQRVLGVLVVVEVALALVLLIGAGLMTRSFAQLIRVNPGFEPNNVIAAQIYLPTTKYREPHMRARFFEEAVANIRTLPGIEAAAAVTSLPMHPVGIDFALPFTIEGRMAPQTGEEPRADIRATTPGYFETMKIRLVDGRLLDERDGADAPHTMLINETMARQHFSDEDPLGQVIENPHGKSRVVGIVGDLRHYGLDSEPRSTVYLPFQQNPFNGMAIVVRTAGDPRDSADLIRREVLAVDAAQPLNDVSTMTAAISRSVFLPRLSMWLLGGFAILALVLAVVGIYGVISYAVSQRTKELGLRMALGADSGDTVWLVLRRSMTLVITGIVVGLLGATLLTRWLSGVLYGVSPLDPAVFLGVSALLAGAAFIATVVPARRATRVDPIVALRVE